MRYLIAILIGCIGATAYAADEAPVLPTKEQFYLQEIGACSQNKASSVGALLDEIAKLRAEIKALKSEKKEEESK